MKKAFWTAATAAMVGLLGWLGLRLQDQATFEFSIRDRIPTAEAQIAQLQAAQRTQYTTIIDLLAQIQRAQEEQRQMQSKEQSKQKREKEIK